jgi:hypothetical protein
VALHDFLCPDCGRVFTDVHVPIAVGGPAGAPRCDACGGQTDWIPAVGRMDAKEPFQKFTAYDGRNRPVEIDSLRKLRQVERESEQLARNGEGQQIVFRMYAQDGSNSHVNTLGDQSGASQKPTEAAIRKFGSVLRSQEAPEVGFGPGVDESNASALGGVETVPTGDLP